MAKYKRVIEAGIGRALISTSVSNSFPLVGETVTLFTKTKWSERIIFDKQQVPGGNIHEEKHNNTQNESTTVSPLAAADLRQIITATNHKFSTEVYQYLYAMYPKTEPYFTVEAASEIVRTNEMANLYFRSENGFNMDTVNRASVRIYKENDYTTPIKTFGNIYYNSSLNCYQVGEFNIPTRGYYDVEAEFTNRSGQTTTRRINKLITVSPRLAARPTQEQIDNKDYTTIIADAKYGVELKMYETGTNDLYCIFDLKEGQTDNDSGFYQWLHLDKMPFDKDAYTIVLRKDYSYKEGNYPSRILVGGSVDHAVGSENGTPQFSHDIPLVFTIDQDFPLVILGIYYSGVNYLNNTRNTVWDGRGYYNLSKGIKFDRYDISKYWEDAFMLMNGTSDVELFELEMCNMDFTPIMTKTDPTARNPWYWKENWEYHNFVWHHCYMHDTGGEGCYLGYFTPKVYKNTLYSGNTITLTNLKGEEVTYEKGRPYNMMAHRIYGLRVFRNYYQRTGYDSMQVSNSLDSEVCYNIVEEGAFKNEKDQASGASVQSMDGLIYNNAVFGHQGPAFQLGPYMGKVEFFNNTCFTTNKTDAIQFLWDLDNPDQNPTGGESGVINDIIEYILYNNTLVTGRYTANGRNTLQVQKIFFIDNILVNEGRNFSNMTVETLDLWESQKEGNFITTPNIFFSTEALKIADPKNHDFRLSADSPLSTYGTGKHFKFDARGYKNWDVGTGPAGAYMGTFKGDSILIKGIEITNKISLIQGSYQLLHTLIPENTTQKGVIWRTSDPSIATVSTSGLVTVIGNGNITITVTSRLNSGVSDSFSTSCEYVNPPTNITITLDREDKIYIGDKISAIASVTPKDALQSVTWGLQGGEELEDITPTSVSFVAKTIGNKVLRATHKDFTNIRDSKSINIVERPASGSIRIAYRAYENGTLPATNRYRNGIVVLSYLTANNTYPLTDINGNKAGIITAVTIINAIPENQVGLYSSILTQNSKGFTIDELSPWTAYTGSNGTNIQKITDISGRYKISIFASNNYTIRPASPGAFYTISSDDVTHNFTVPTIENNQDQWMEQEILIGPSGLTIEYGNNGGTGGYSMIPINAILLEPLT